MEVVLHEICQFEFDELVGSPWGLGEGPTAFKGEWAVSFGFDKVCAISTELTEGKGTFLHGGNEFSTSSRI